MLSRNKEGGEGEREIEREREGERERGREGEGEGEGDLKCVTQGPKERTEKVPPHKCY